MPPAKPVVVKEAKAKEKKEEKKPKAKKEKKKDEKAAAVEEKKVGGEVEVGAQAPVKEILDEIIVELPEEEGREEAVVEGKKTEEN